MALAKYGVERPAQAQTTKARQVHASCASTIDNILLPLSQGLLSDRTVVAGSGPIKDAPQLGRSRPRRCDRALNEKHQDFDGLTFYPKV